MRKVWCGPIPSDEKIEAAYEKWKAESAKQTDYQGDFYFDFAMTLTTYGPVMWMHLFE